MSVHDRSKPSNEFVIFSVDRGKYEDARNRLWIKSHMRGEGITFKGVQGVWEGVEECSFLVSKDDFARIRKTVFQGYNQDAVLHLGNPEGHSGHRPAWLEYSNGDWECIGWFHSVSKDYAAAQKGWTYDPSQDRFFCVTEYREAILGQFR